MKHRQQPWETTEPHKPAIFVLLPSPTNPTPLRELGVNPLLKALYSLVQISVHFCCYCSTPCLSSRCIGKLRQYGKLHGKIDSVFRAVPMQKVFRFSAHAVDSLIRLDILLYVGSASVFLRSWDLDIRVTYPFILYAPFYVSCDNTSHTPYTKMIFMLHIPQRELLNQTSSTDRSPGTLRMTPHSAPFP